MSNSHVIAKFMYNKQNYKYFYAYFLLENIAGNIDKNIIAKKFISVTPLPGRL